jgi:pimeloyl-ACP methyl ester carboxylesterase
LAGAHSTVVAADGRALEIATAGPADGAPLFVLHGTPGSASLFGPNVALAAARGLRLIAYSRPGYGASDRVAGRSVGHCAGDVRAIADALGLDRFHVMGGSGGGPHALACARLLPDRVIAAATVASGAPLGAVGLDWTAGMARENVEEFAAVEAGAEALLAYLEREAEAMVAADDVADGMGDLVSDVDRGALTGEFAEYIGAQLGRALLSGVWGWFDDDVALCSDWGFDLDGIQVPVSIWHGGEDRFVPIAHGEWLAAHVPGARAHLLPAHGHLSLSVGAYGEILDDLVARGGA